MNAPSLIKTRKIPAPIDRLLWGKSGAYCQFKGCVNPLWKHHVSQKTANIAEKAHIYAFNEGGKRYSEIISGHEINSMDNLLLVCRSCHAEIDGSRGEVEYPVEKLQEWKRAHEAKIERIMQIDSESTSEVILYRAAVGDFAPDPSSGEASEALASAGLFPHSERPISLKAGKSQLTDADDGYWPFYDGQLQVDFDRFVRRLLEDGGPPSFAIFAIAPQPLLIRLGTLFTDIPNVVVFQPHRTPKGWSWPAKEKSIEVICNRPQDTSNPPVLKVSLTAAIDDSRVTAVTDEQHSIWELTVKNPSRHCMRSRADLQEFSEKAWEVLEEIEKYSPKGPPLKIFPASPVSPMIELGRIRQGRVYRPWTIYNQKNESTGFVETITIKN